MCITYNSYIINIYIQRYLYVINIYIQCYLYLINIYIQCYIHAIKIYIKVKIVKRNIEDNLYKMNPNFDYVVYDEINNLLSITNFNKEKAIKNNGVFRLITNRKGYYCEDNICKNDRVNSLSESDKKIYRDKDCWNMCKNPIIKNKSLHDDKSLHELKVVSQKNGGKFNYIYLLIGIITVLIIVVIVLKYF